MGLILCVILPCYLQTFKAIGQLRQDLSANEFSRDLGLICVSDGYPMLHKAPGSLYTSFAKGKN